MWVFIVVVYFMVSTLFISVKKRPWRLLVALQYLFMIEKRGSVQQSKIFTVCKISNVICYYGCCELMARCWFELFENQSNKNQEAGSNMPNVIFVDCPSSCHVIIFHFYSWYAASLRRVSSKLCNMLTSLNSIYVSSKVHTGDMHW